MFNYFIKNIFLTAVALLPAIAIAQSNGNFTLKGKIANLNAPAKAYLVQVLPEGLKPDSAVITNGSFSFAGKVAEPVNAYLLIDHKGVGYANLDRSVDVLPLYLEKGNITLTSRDSVAKAVIAGSALNKDDKLLQTSIQPATLKLKAFTEKANAATPEQQRSPEFREKTMAEYRALLNEYKGVIANFIKTHPNSYASLLTLRSVGGEKPDPSEFEPLFNVLSKKLRESPMGLAFKAQLDQLKATAIGGIAPDFTQADVNGAPVKLSSFRGKYVLLDFWASWCGPCRQENPNVVSAYNKYKDKNFTVLGVSVDRQSGKNAWLNAIKNDGLTWTQVSDLKAWENEAAILYDVHSIPQNFLIDPSGKIVAKNLRGPALTAKLEELLGKI